MRKRIIIFATIVFATIQAFSQYRIAPVEVVQCPNNQITYKLEKQNAGGNWEQVSPEGFWELTNGTPSSEGSLASLNLLLVTWNDGFDSGTIYAKHTEIVNGVETTYTYAYLVVTLNSIKHKTPSEISGTTSFNFGQNTSTYSITKMKYPNNTDVNSYSWIIPPGWSLGGVVSTGSNVYSGNGASITVTTDNTTGGVIKVAGENSLCSGASNSLYQTKAVSRTFPEFSITTTTENEYYQGDTTPITYSVPNWSYASYSWSKPFSWQFQGSSTNPTVTLIPDGCNNGTISCLITVPATGQSTTKSIVSPYVLTNPINVVPYITGTSTVCSTGSYALQNIPERTTSYSWTAGNNLSVASGQGTSSISANKTGNGSSTVKVIISVGGCMPIYFTKTVWAGKPIFTISGETPIETYMYGVASLDYQAGSISNVAWSRSGAITSVTGGLATGRYRAGGSAGIGEVYALATNSCGSTENRLLVQVNDSWYMAYPNPATTMLTVEIDETKMPDDVKSKKVEVRLLDKTQRIKKQKELKDKKTEIDVSDLAPDVYFLQILTDKEVAIEKIVIQ